MPFECEAIVKITVENRSGFFGLFTSEIESGNLAFLLMKFTF